MNLFKRKITVITHDGKFHADDIFACAALLLWTEKNGKKLKIIRSRNKEVIKKADITIDVGGIYDPDKNKFDHHQAGGSGLRENGVPYASFGLVWKKYGKDVCGDKKIADRIEKGLVIPLDARDSGLSISKANELGINDHRTSNMISGFNLTWQENEKLSRKQFEKALNFSKEILLREIAWAKTLILGEEETIEVMREQNEPEILILDKSMEWNEAVSKNDKIKFVIYPRKEKKEWGIQTGRDDLEDYDSDRVKFPKSWAGLRDEELVRKSGVKDAIFCINGRWLAVARTKEGAIEMANKALRNSSD